MASIGILGGTFNPPHLAHLVCAQEAREQLSLDVVALMPAGVPPHKESPEDPGGAERAHLCRLAVAGDDRLTTCEAELRREGASYTADTLRGLRAERPDDELTWIVGGDMAASLPEWHQPEEILRLGRVAVAERAGDRRDRIAAHVAGLAGSERIAYIDMPRIDISSSMIRDRVRAGRSIRYLVCDAVARRIAARGLYRRAPRSSAGVAR